jgi:hypothetical protein
VIRISTAERELLMDNQDVLIEEAVISINGMGFRTQNLGGTAAFAIGTISDELIFAMLRGIAIETLCRAGWAMPTSAEQVAEVLSKSPVEAVESFANGRTDGFRIFDLLIEDHRLYRIVAIPSLTEKKRYFVGTMVREVRSEDGDQYLDEPDISILTYADRPTLN